MGNVVIVGIYCGVVRCGGYGGVCLFVFVELVVDYFVKGFCRLDLCVMVGVGYGWDGGCSVELCLYLYLIGLCCGECGGGVF